MKPRAVETGTVQKLLGDKQELPIQHESGLTNAEEIKKTILIYTWVASQEALVLGPELDLRTTKESLVGAQRDAGTGDHPCLDRPHTP